MPLGPLHAYVAPVIVDAFKEIVEPSQTVLSPDKTGDAGTGFIVTCTLPAGLVQPLTVTVAE